MKTDDIKAAEQRGYSKGYNAGRRRKQRDIDAERQRKERQAFLDRAFLAVLPTALAVQGWKFGETPITSTADRVQLAVRWAEQALVKRPFA